MGCGTRIGSYCGMPSAVHWAWAAVRNSVVVTFAVGMPFSSKPTTSCELHEMQPPQSLRASITASHFSSNSFFTSTGTVRPGVSFRRRKTSFTPCCWRRISSSRSRKNSPLALLISSRPIVLPARVPPERWDQVITPSFEPPYCSIYYFELELL
jgi:hypothetical protein